MILPLNLPNKLSAQNSVLKIPAREEIPEKYKWDLSAIYKSDEEWEEDYKQVEMLMPQFLNYQGRLNDSAEILAACLKFNEKIGIKLDRLSLYASLNKDSDMRNQNYQAMFDRIQTLYAKVSSISSFINPEIVEIPEQKIQSMIGSNDELKVYKHLIDNLIREKPHTLSKPEEKILALTEEISILPYNAYSIFVNSDMKFTNVSDEEGRNIEVSHARFYSAMHSRQREYRKQVFKNYLKPYCEYVNTIGVLFNGNLKAKIFNAKARGYNSAREAALFKNNIPISVYNNLIQTTNLNLTPLHRWASIKKKLLKLDELHPYDLYVSIFDSNSEKKYTFEEAAEMINDAMKPLGSEYLKILQTAFKSRWIDVFETQAKKSGAYSSGTTFGVHPFVLMNWEGLIYDVFTLAHEMGHNMHSYFTGQNQPYPYANYSIFLAEVASTFNESLLLQYLIQHSESISDKLFFIEIYLNNISSTFYRQVMFSEFEKIVYDETERGISLTPNLLSKIYKEIYKKYWGDEMIVDEEEESTWARIPHFYYNFYVYQYATGFAASQILSQKILHNGSDAIEDYLNFLKAGSSDYPINILKKAGVDMNSSETILSVTSKMNSLLDDLEQLIS